MRSTVLNVEPVALEGALVIAIEVDVILVIRGAGDLGHRVSVLDLLVTTAVLAHEAHGGCEDDFAPLAGLDRPCCKRLAGADAFDVVYNGDLCVAGKDKVAVHRVDGEV
jgi:hypothetical protein